MRSVVSCQTEFGVEVQAQLRDLGDGGRDGLVNLGLKSLALRRASGLGL